MATNFPASLDTLTNPTSSDSLSSPSHSAQHANVNDAVEALQAKVGVDSSAVSSSLDYKVAQLEAISHGKILQVVSTTKTDVSSTSSTSFVDVTGLSVSITPTSASSTILLHVQVNYSLTLPTSAYHLGFFRLLRDATVIGVGDSAGNRIQSTFFTQTRSGYLPADSMISASTMLVDSPATASSVTYKVQTQTGQSAAGTAAIYINRSYNDGDNTAYGRGISTITAMEVSA